MYISGHKLILKKILKLLPNDYFTSEEVKMLTNGIIYADLPCGIYEIKDDKVFMSDTEVCNMMSLTKIVQERYQIKEIYQSHKGMYAFFHSMSPSPILKVSQVLHIIMDHIISLAFLSVTNVFWIGRILHIITDSYSQSHTMRKNRPTQTSPSIKPHDNQIFELIVKLAQDPKVYTKTELQFILREHGNIGISRLYKAYKMHLFYEQTLKESTNYTDLDLPIISHTQEYDIFNFQYYNAQTSFYHKKYDFFSYMETHKDMYDRMIEECLRVIEIYKTAITKIKENPEDKLDITKNYIKDLRDYLYNSTFRIASTNLDNLTNQVYLR